MVQITATEKSWNSATTLYIARKLQSLGEAKAHPLKVLDMGCGDGSLIKFFFDYGHDLHGYDSSKRETSLRENIGAIFGDAFDEHIHFMPDERTIPFADDSFDVIYCNQVFEHVRFLDQLLSECVRVLKPGGTLITLFPLATYLIEGHLKIPFAHQIPPGSSRIRYMQLFYFLRIRPLIPGKNARQTAETWENYLNNRTYYRFMNEVVSLFEYYFESWEIDTPDYIRAKLDLLRVRRSWRNRMILGVARMIPDHVLSNFVTHYLGCAFYVSNPREK